MAPRRKQTNVAFQDIARFRTQLFEQMMRGDGMTLSQSWVLANVVARDGQTQKELAETVMVGTVTVGGLIDRLEARGLVFRKTDPEDRRANRIYAQPEAYKMVKTIMKAIKRLDEIAYRGMSREDVEKLDDILPQVRKNLRAELFVDEVDA